MIILTLEGLITRLPKLTRHNACNARTIMTTKRELRQLFETVPCRYPNKCKTYRICMHPISHKWVQRLTRDTTSRWSSWPRSNTPNWPEPTNSKNYCTNKPMELQKRRLGKLPYCPWVHKRSHPIQLPQRKSSPQPTKQQRHTHARSPSTAQISMGNQSNKRWQGPRNQTSGKGYE